MEEREAIKKILILSPEEIHKCSKKHGWWEGGERNFGELMALVHSEISEAFEAYRKDVPYSERHSVPEELADTVIRIFDIAYHYQIDIASEIMNKHLINLKRAYRHGGKKC